MNSGYCTSRPETSWFFGQTNDIPMTLPIVLKMKQIGNPFNIRMLRLLPVLVSARARSAVWHTPIRSPANVLPHVREHWRIPRDSPMFAHMRKHICGRSDWRMPDSRPSPCRHQHRQKAQHPNVEWVSNLFHLQDDWKSHGNIVCLPEEPGRFRSARTITTVHPFCYMAMSSVCRQDRIQRRSVFHGAESKIGQASDHLGSSQHA